MSAYDFINEYFPGWEVVGFTLNGYNQGTVLIRDGEVDLKVHVDMNDAVVWQNSDVTPSYVEVSR
jgi:hypothetical protein